MTRFGLPSLHISIPILHPCNKIYFLHSYLIYIFILLIHWFSVNGISTKSDCLYQIREEPVSIVVSVFRFQPKAYNFEVYNPKVYNQKYVTKSL